MLYGLKNCVVFSLILFFVATMLSDEYTIWKLVLFFFCCEKTTKENKMEKGHSSQSLSPELKKTLVWMFFSPSVKAPNYFGPWFSGIFVRMYQKTFVPPH